MFHLNYNTSDDYSFKLTYRLIHQTTFLPLRKDHYLVVFPICQGWCYRWAGYNNLQLCWTNRLPPSCPKVLHLIFQGFKTDHSILTEKGSHKSENLLHTIRGQSWLQNGIMVFPTVNWHSWQNNLEIRVVLRSNV